MYTQERELTCTPPWVYFLYACGFCSPVPPTPTSSSEAVPEFGLLRFGEALDLLANECLSLHQNVSVSSGACPEQAAKHGPINKLFAEHETSFFSFPWKRY